MSRSFKKYGIIKDKGMSRGEYNRRFRRVNRQLIKERKDPKLMYEIANQYDVCDFKIRWERVFIREVNHLSVRDTKKKIQHMKREYFRK
jgi:hypothetical protein